MERTLLFWFGLLLLYTFTDVCDAVRCLQCKDRADPRTCTHVTSCADGEECYLEEVVTLTGQIVFQSGCMPKAQCSVFTGLPLGRRSLGKRVGPITTCIECCNTDVCNLQGCGQKVDPVGQQRGPICYACNLTSEGTHCDTAVQCAVDEICGLYTPRDNLGMPNVVFESTCISKPMCTALHGAFSNTRCIPTCCDSDFCNVACNSSHSHIVTTQTTSTNTSNCPADYIVDSVSGMCIKVFSGQTVTWQQAEAACVANGDILATVDNQQKNDFVETAMRANHIIFAWIGGYDKYDTTSFYWAAGPQFQYTNWGGHDDLVPNQQPDDNDHHPQNCVGVYGKDYYKWHDALCTDTYDGYVCEHVNGTPSQVTLPCSSTDGYQNFGHGLCLKIHTEHTTWEDARARCLQEHADLVVLDTKEKSDALNAYLDANEKRIDFWLGGYDKNKDRTWYWVSGSPFTFVDWFIDPTGRYSQPNTLDQYCVAAWTQSGYNHHHWQDKYCTDQREFICQRAMN